MSKSMRDASRRGVLKKILVGSGVMTTLPCVAQAGVSKTPPEMRESKVRLHLDNKLEPLEISRYGVGHGGYTDQTTWLDRAGSEIRALNPKLIRLFIQEYYDLLPAFNQYNWKKLDASVDMILQTGAKPLMCIVFRPKLLFPNPALKVVEPTDWGVWGDLVYNVVRHYKECGAGIQYWEVGNEPPHGGDTPYEFTVESYLHYYRQTVAAVRRADPEARVGGPASDFYTSPFLPALLSFCDREKLPLDFVSWHIYNPEPQVFREGVKYVKKLLSKYPSFRLETILDEWNAGFGSLPDPDPCFLPCHILETTYQMKEAGLDYSCFFQIRDGFVAPEVMSFLPPGTAADWDQILIFSVNGLFDYQNMVQPSYFAFRLLSHLTGVRVKLESADSAVHGLASYDEKLDAYCVLLWNFSKNPVHVEVTVEGAPSSLRVDRVVLNARTPATPCCTPLYPQAPLQLTAGKTSALIDLDGYGITYWSLRQGK
jgi:hypothetical protein